MDGDTKVARLKGDIYAERYKINSGVLRVRFRSDGSNTRRGFRASYFRG